MGPDRLPCDLIQDLLPLYHDGVTSETTHRLVEDHLETCPTCQAEYESLVRPLPPASAVPETDLKPQFRKMVKTWRARNIQGVLGAILGVIFLAVAAYFLLLVAPSATLSPEDYSDVHLYRFEEDGDACFFFLSITPYYEGLPFFGYNGSGSLGYRFTYENDAAILHIDADRPRFGHDATDTYHPILWDVFIPAETTVRGRPVPVTEVRLAGQTIWTQEANGADPVPSFVQTYRQADGADGHPRPVYSARNKYLGVYAPNGDTTLWTFDGQVLYQGAVEDLAELYDWP